MTDLPSAVPAAPPSSGLFEGVLEMDERGDGMVRDLKKHLAIHPQDPAVPRDLIRKLGLRNGDVLGGAVTSGGRKLLQVKLVHGKPVEKWSPPPALEETTAIDPNRALRFDSPGGPHSMWIVSLFTPIGRGQRGLIVAPPRTGKTILLQQLASGIHLNQPEMKLFLLLVDERPEEVTEMRRHIPGQVFASSNDRETKAHIRLARLVIEYSKRLVENGEHIVILLDSITRLARAYNNNIQNSGRTMTGGLDIRALQEPKQIFGAARNIENGGSLTIMATALVDTGSRADDFIFQEFKGTGNMELALDRELANQRIWPALNLRESGTRKEEKLLAADTLAKVTFMRRHLLDLPPAKQIQSLLEKMQPHKDLDAYLGSLKTPV